MADRKDMSLSPHLRGIVIAGVLAAVALALGFVTLGMNQSSSAAAPHAVLSLKARHLASAAPTTPAVKPKKRKPVDVNLVAALKAGLPRSVAKALAAHRVAVVSLTSSHDSVAAMAAREAQAGAVLADASFVPLSVDHDGGGVALLTKLLGTLPVAPATLVYVRPASLYIAMPGFNDKTTIQQAAVSAASGPAPSAAVAAAAAGSPAPPVPVPVETTVTDTTAATPAAAG